MTNSAELRARLQSGIQDLESDLARLRAALAALDQSEPQSSQPRQARQPRARRRPRAASTAPAPEVVPAGKLAKLLGDSDGLSTSQLAVQTGGAPDQVLAILKELEQAGQAHRTGNRRTTRWHSGKAPRSGRRTARRTSQAAATAAARRTSQAAATATETERQLADALEPVVAS
jgi:hypothetical protein